MTTEERERFRVGVLSVLDANRTRFGLGVSAVRLLVGTFGFEGVAAEEVRDAIEYLEGKGLVEEVLKQVSRENRCWRITAAGVGFLDERGG
jgi:hypothetical protein